MYGPCCRWLWTALIALLLGWARAGAEDAVSPRTLAPGVLTVIPSSVEEGETSWGPVSIPEIVTGIPNLDWTPNYGPKSQTLLEKAKRVVYRHPVWCLEFAFKPLRMIEVDVPQPGGKMQRKLIWYLVYRVKNVGYDLNPVGAEDRWGQRLFTFEEVNFRTRRFFPRFVLRSLEYDKEYLDRIIPAAQRAIQKRENPGAKLHNSVEITQVEIPLSDERADRSVWGVATWQDIDPRIDFFVVFVGGLTNAFQTEDPPGAYKAGDPPGTGRVYRHKTLQLNFWRPGDPVLEHEREIRYGMPADPDPAAQQQIIERYGLKARLDYAWVYR